MPIIIHEIGYRCHRLKAVANGQIAPSHSQLQHPALRKSGCRHVRQWSIHKGAEGILSSSITCFHATSNFADEGKIKNTMEDIRWPLSHLQVSHRKVFKIGVYRSKVFFFAQPSVVWYRFLTVFFCREVVPCHGIHFESAWAFPYM